MKISTRVIGMVLSLFLLIGCFSVNSFADSNLMHGIGFVTASALRLREAPNTKAKVVATAGKDECVVVVAPEGDWYKVIYNLQEGYMHKDYLSVLTTENAELGYGKVTGASVNLRTGPATSYTRVASASKGEKCYILGLNQGWYKVIYGNRIAYIRSDYLELTEIPYENSASEHSPKFYRLGKSTGTIPSAAALTGSTSAAAKLSGSQIVTEAKRYLGTPYVYGGASPKGFDCSGFVYYVFHSLGCSIARTPAAQIGYGKTVSKNQLQPGDIVFFSGTGGASGISHVGIYVGGGQFIHSPNSRSVVSYADLTTGYWAQHYYGARRLA